MSALCVNCEVRIADAELGTVYTVKLDRNS